jgi:hypothetical protein
VATSLALRAKAELELRRRNVDRNANPLAEYQFDVVRYVIDKLGWHPWAGDGEHAGQVEVMQAYELALRQLHERHEYWQPGQVIKNRIRVEAGHTVGKTMAASGIFSHFFDTCAPAIIYSFAPSYEQINDLLWKEIRTARRAANLPGRVLEVPELKLSGNYFAKGRATNDSHGTGTERVQGQHGKYLMFIVDEAEGVADFVFSAIKSMTSGGIAIVLMLANPRTRISQFYKQRSRDDVVNFRISCVYHPNVLADREIVPGAVRREYVEDMIKDHAEEVDAHNVDADTFELPWRPGTIYKPDAECMFRVLGIPPANISDNTIITTGRYESACNRQPESIEPTKARIGIDVARYGTDNGTIYVRHDGRIWRHKQISGQDTNTYRAAIIELCEWLQAQGVTDLQIRVDGGGGYASGIIDPLRIDMGFQAMFKTVNLYEVHNNGEPTNKAKYADKVTEMYAESAETMNGYAVVKPPPQLEQDLTDRRYGFANKSGVTVRRLEEKDLFKKRNDRSPDDGDGFVLSASPDHIFNFGDPWKLVDFA